MNCDMNLVSHLRVGLIVWALLAGALVGLAGDAVPRGLRDPGELQSLAI